MDRKFFLIILFLCLYNTSVFPQRLFKFSGDPQAYYQELTTFMGPNLLKQDQDYLVEFLPVWDSVWFSDSSREQIIEISNRFVEKRARPVPHFINLMKLLETSMNSDLDPQQFEILLTGLKQLTERQDFTLSLLNHFLTRLDNYLTDRTLFSSPLLKWYTTTRDFQFHNEEVFYVRIPETDLIGKSREDSLIVFNTSGRYIPAEAVWQGEKGLVTWEKAGLNRQDVYADLKKFELILSRQEYKADSVIFYNKNYFPEPMLGVLTDRIVKADKPENINFPVFESYRQSYSIDHIFRDFFYTGGISMHGGRFIGSGSQQEVARMDIFRHDSLVISLRSRRFVFLPNRTFSTNTSLTIYLDRDSIYHPDLGFNYLSVNDEISFYRSEKAISRSPYSNSFHNLDMTFDQLIWQRTDSIMYFTMPRASITGNANFESINFFNRQQYDRLQGMDFQNPLVLVRNFQNYFIGEVLPATDFAHFARKNVSEVRNLLMDLTLRGYVFYDIENDHFTIREKLYNTLAASTNRIDYDVINFASNTNAPEENGSLNLNTYDLTINGIPRVYISNFQNVNIFPRNRKVTIKKNRNFQFDGIINAGYLTFFGSNFFFDYDDFMVTLQKVDSVSIRTESGMLDELGRKLLIQVQSLIQIVTGVLYIDQPDNKSGKESYLDYPKFTSTENSVVLFNSPSIHKGVYTADKVYFTVYPFSMDSLNTFQNKDLRFRGRLVSGGIFPDIEQTVTLQPDYSLGFVHQTPPEGLPAYGGKGTYNETIFLSNEGIRGSGKISYLTSELFSEEYFFFPDSVNAASAEINMKQRTSGTPFPVLQARDNHMQWLPKSDNISLKQQDKPFMIHNQSTSLHGNVLIEPSGLSGSGTMLFQNASLKSNLFRYGAIETHADTASMVLKIPDNTDNSFTAADFKVTMNHSTGRGQFISSTGINRIELPINRYAGFIEGFDWTAGESTMLLKSSSVQDSSSYAGARYVSLVPRQDSLSFVSPGLLFNYRTNLMEASGVEHLYVADVLIEPHEGSVSVEEGANMRTLEKSVILANRTDQLHRIYNASTLVESKNKYNAQGSYDYLDMNNQVQKIHFEKVEVDKTGQTIAQGKILEPDAFTLSPYFEYQGEVRLSAEKPLLNFKGGARVVHDCDKPYRTWLAFESEINPNAVYIPVSPNPVDLNNDKVFTGTFIGNDSIYIYPSFASFRRKFNDQQITHAGEFLRYDETSGKYIIGSKERFWMPQHPGNFISLDRNTCELYSEGIINPDINLGQFKMAAAGSAVHRISENSLEMDILLSMDFLLNDPALDLMAKDLDSLPGPETVFFRFPNNRMRIQEFIGTERTDVLWSVLEEDGRFRVVPPEISKTITLNNLKLKWSQESRSYQSYGKFEVLNIGSRPVHKSVTGFLEISKRRSGDFLDLYIEIDPQNFYYFGYTRGVLMAFSSNNDFNQTLMLPPLRQRQIRVRGLDTPYTYMIATDTRIWQFFERYQRVMELRRESESKFMDTGEENSLPDEESLEN